MEVNFLKERPFPGLDGYLGLAEEQDVLRWNWISRDPWNLGRLRRAKKRQPPTVKLWRRIFVLFAAPHTVSHAAAFSNRSPRRSSRPFPHAVYECCFLNCASCLPHLYDSIASLSAVYEAPRHRQNFVKHFRKESASIRTLKLMLVRSGRKLQ